ncbi:MULTISPECIES: hypothetical protein [unclassified Arcicella]|uniref:hypothetical protein n=1 Tax=unclassified Arcicella TaxID=2644986 RepID=UPI002854D3E0|nr:MULTISPECIES: hypothetical protein [unclassified Arcicella]MDR6564707.1 hypothetical protein [Arcicella sp. BE51]MDR6814503.1 hypothetical protein [Arcicella sp. BE140]MDR6825910.1 hypothetical protein [Arcicella sp. BE139]
MENIYRKYYFLSQNQLKTIFEKGKQPITSDLVGWEFMGVNIGVLTKVLGIRKFFKVFTTHVEGDAIIGYNLKAQQNGLDEPHLKALMTNNTDGYYHVSEDGSSKTLLINYGHHQANARFSPVRLLRDYLVEVEPDIYLGKAYLKFFSFFVPLTYFVLRKYQKRLD